MKIAILGDSHFGARNSNRVTQHWQERFYNEIFWPYIDANDIKTIIQTGDYFDDRKSINLQSLAFQRNVFVKEAQKRNVDVHVLVGNHDIPLRHSLRNSSVEQVLAHEDNFHVYTQPTKVEFDDLEMTMMPWICKENFEQAKEVIQNGGDHIVGHFEITGFVMHPGAISKDGISMADFNGWNQVLSGHYHAQSEKGNVHYVGTPYQMSWSDATTKHGFWVLDTADRSRTFINNPLRYFNRFVWEDGCLSDLGDLERSYVKIAVKKKTDFEAFETFIDKVNFGSPHDVKIIEQFEEWSQENVKDLITVSSTEDLISDYVNDVATANNKDNIKQIMLSIYEEANRMHEE